MRYVNENRTHLSKSSLNHSTLFCDKLYVLDNSNSYPT